MRVMRVLFFGLVAYTGLLMAKSTGIYLGGTRVIFDSGKAAATISVNNASQGVWLMRFWVSPYDEGAASSAPADNASTPFIVTPPLYRLDPGSSVQLRINRVTDGLANDRESVFYLNSLAIPPKKGSKGYDKSVKSGLQFAVNTRIKLFYRPSTLNDASRLKSLPEQLTVTAANKQLLIKNPTPYYITAVQLLVNGQEVKTQADTMLAPYGQLSLPLTVPHGNLNYRTINDGGAMTPVITKTF